LKKEEIEILSEKSKNPIVRKALKRRIGGFVFNYGEKTHNDRAGYDEYLDRSHSEYREYDDRYMVYYDHKK
jgi:hypothetical protein